jgi:nucleoside 2-deoxyribosyltransferase
MKILVAGGLRPDFRAGGAEELCARALGRALASGGHTLVNGCYNAFDALVAEAAHAAALPRAGVGEAPLAIHSYVSPGITPSHRLGKLQSLNVNSWDPGQPEWGIPEPLRECEALVVMGGGPATHRVIHLTRLAGKPILPIATFGGAGHEAYRTECERFGSVYSGRLTKDEYSVLNTALEALDAPDAFDRLATSIVSLATKIALGNTVFVVMSFNEDADDTFGTIERVCRLYGFEPERTDKSVTTERIYKRIVDGIQRAALVIADVTFESLNVYYELGFAEALGKDVIVVAKEGVKLPFDTSDIPTCFFKNQTRLEEVLRSRIGRLTGRASRSVGV